MLLWYYLDVVLLSDDGYARLVVNQMTNTYTINVIQGMIGGSSGGVFKLIQLIVIIGDLSSILYFYLFIYYYSVSLL